MTIDINENAVIQEPVIDKRCKSVYCPQLDKRWDSAVDRAYDLKLDTQTLYNTLNGMTHAYYPLEFFYEQNITQCTKGTRRHVHRLLCENEHLKQQLDAEKKLADQMRAIIAKEEEKRKTEDAATRALDEAITKFERCKATVERKEAEYQDALSLYSAAEKEMHEAELNLLKAKGEIK